MKPAPSVHLAVRGSFRTGVWLAVLVVQSVSVSKLLLQTGLLSKQENGILLKRRTYKFVRDGVANFELLLAKSTDDFLPVLPVIL
jgi:hypothetical protein